MIANQKVKTVIALVLLVLVAFVSIFLNLTYNATIKSYKNTLIGANVPQKVSDEFAKIQAEQYRVYIPPILAWISALGIYLFNFKPRSRISWDDGKVTITSEAPLEANIFYNYNESQHAKIELNNKEIFYLNFSWKLNNSEKDAIKNIKIKNISIQLPTEENQNPNESFELIAVKVENSCVVPVYKKQKERIRAICQVNSIDNILTLSWIINRKNSSDVIKHLANSACENSIRLTLNADVKFKYYFQQRYNHIIDFEKWDTENESAMVRSIINVEKEHTLS